MNEVKVEVLKSQQAYTSQIVMVDDQTELKVLDESIGIIDGAMDSLSKVTDAFRKGIGSHIKKLSV